MDSSKDQSILVENLQASVKQLKIRKHFTFQHDNDTKHKPKSTKEWRQKKINVLEWCRQSPDPNPIKPDLNLRLKNGSAL